MEDWIAFFVSTILRDTYQSVFCGRVYSFSPLSLERESFCEVLQLLRLIAFSYIIPLVLYFVVL